MTSLLCLEWSDLFRVSSTKFTSLQRQNVDIYRTEHKVFRPKVDEDYDVHSGTCGKGKGFMTQKVSKYN